MTGVRDTARSSTARRVPSISREAAVSVAFYAGVGVLTTLLAIWRLGLFDKSWRIPLFYASDALSGGAQVKGTIENGWYEVNPDLGAPFGQNLHDFPIADNMQFIWAKVLGLFTDQWAVVYNLSYLATYPAAALAAAWFLRVVGVRRSLAAVFAILYAFIPYHFFHGVAHLALSQYFVVPLMAALILKTLEGQPIFARRTENGSRWNPLTWATPTSAATVLIVAVTGTTSSYYSVFGLILFSVALLVCLLRRQIGRVVAGAVAMVGLMGVMVLNMAPDMLYARTHTASYIAFTRYPLESDLYGLKLAQLVFPAPWYRISAVREWRADYDATFPLPSEKPMLGLLAAAGFLFLLALPAISMLRKRYQEHGVFGSTQRHLALLNLVAFMFGTIGGLATLFALFVSPSIRAWNRISVYIALFALAAVALLLQRLVTWWLRRHRPAPRVAQGVLGVGCVLLLAFGLFDQTPPTTSTAVGDEEQRWKVDEQYVAAIEREAAPGTMVFELPALVFPESQPVTDIQDYEPIRPYLHSTDLRWSYGGVKGRPTTDWPQILAGRGPKQMLVQLSASGFGGIHLDRYGYPGHDAGEVEATFREALGEPIVSTDDRFAYFDMTAFNARVQDAYSADQLQTIARHTVRVPVAYWNDFEPPTPDANGLLVYAGKSADVAATIGNPGKQTTVEMTFTIRADGTSTAVPVTVRWPDGKSTVESVGPEGKEVTRRFEIPGGRSALRFTGPGLPSVSILNPVMAYPALDFGMHGLFDDGTEGTDKDTDEGTKKGGGKGADAETGADQPAAVG